jgi:hypothetical protein
VSKQIRSMNEPRQSIQRRRRVFRALTFVVMGLLLMEIGLRGLSALASQLYEFKNESQSPALDADFERSQPRVLCVGHSLTLGAESPPHLTFPAQLENLLRAQGQDAKVINQGLPGWPTRRHLDQLPESLKRYRPHILVIWSGDHDFEADTLHEPQPWMVELTRHLKLVQLGAWVYQSLKLRRMTHATPDGDTRYSDLTQKSEDKMLSIIASRVDPLTDPIETPPGPTGTSLKILVQNTQADSPPRRMHSRHWALTRASLFVTEVSDFNASLEVLKQWSATNTDVALSHLLFIEQMSKFAPNPDDWRKLADDHVTRLMSLKLFSQKSTLLEKLREIGGHELYQLNDEEVLSLFTIAPEMPSLAWEAIIRGFRSQVPLDTIFRQLRWHMTWLHDSPVLGQTLLWLRYNTKATQQDILQAWSSLPKLDDVELQVELTERLRTVSETATPDKMRDSLLEVFGEIKQIAQDYGVERILVLGYHPVRAPRSSVFFKYRRTLNDNLEEVARELDLEFVSLERAFFARFGKNKQSFETLNALHFRSDQVWDSHLNASGNAFVATTVEQIIRREKVIWARPSPAPTPSLPPRASPLRAQPANSHSTN